MNIVLVGFMGTGKTAVGKLLSAKMQMKYISTDELIEDKERRSINEIFKKSGEPYFRRLEKEAVKRVCLLDKFIIDAGGGVVLDEENVQMLKKNAKIICLSATGMHQPLPWPQGRQMKLQSRISRRRCQPLPQTRGLRRGAEAAGNQVEL